MASYSVKNEPHLSIVALEVEVHALPEALGAQQRVVQPDDLRALQEKYHSAHTDAHAARQSET
jgi:hypothetical protein